jgi:hypothetical protein
MSESEKLDMKIAQCKICLLSEAMKICPLCAFNMGLVVKVETKEIKENEIK